MRTFLLLVGWMLLGGVAGFITGRWKIAYLLMLGVLGLSLIVDPQPPGLLGESENGGSWPETVAFVAGVIIGGRIGEKDRDRATVNS